MHDPRTLPGYWPGYYAAVRESVAGLYAELPAEWRSRLLVDLARTAPADATPPVSPPPPRVDPRHYGAPAGPKLGAGLHWFALAQSHRHACEVLGVADGHDGPRVVVRVACAEAHRWPVECAAGAVLAATAHAHPRHVAAPPADAPPEHWTWNDGGDGGRYGLPLRWRLGPPDAPTLACWAAPCAPWAADATGRELSARFGLAVAGGAPWAHLAGCRAERTAGGLVVLGDFVDGRTRRHANRRAAKEAASPPARPALGVVRAGARRAGNFQPSPPTPGAAMSAPSPAVLAPRDRLTRLVAFYAELPDDAAALAADVLEVMARRFDPAGAAAAVAPHDEPLTADDRAAIAEGLADLAAGRVLSLADVMRELGISDAQLADARHQLDADAAGA